jgi:4-diphosphocytidyl-2-C-methyl-D-erythritol kinase
MNTLVIRALAKVNLAIDVLDKRSDGYHDIDMVTIPLKLHDSIEITPLSSSFETYLYCDDPTIVCDESNLAYKALDAMRGAFKIDGKYRIFIYKKIPVEAGLGGGSADAAAVIRALSSYLPETPDKEQKINDMAISIGSDVPFCLYDKPCPRSGNRREAHVHQGGDALLCPHREAGWSA